jgi:ribosome-binding protein aMBF1 (putative translation factor)
MDPVGPMVAEHAQARFCSAAYRKESQRLAPYEQLARIVVGRRAELGLTQQELANRVRTSHAAISRIERGRHGTSARMQRRLAAALEIDLVPGFEHSPAERPVPEIVAG